MTVGEVNVGTPSPSWNYSLDHCDRIMWVSDEWVAFARENDAPALSRQNVLGKPIWDFIADEATCQFYREIFARVRATNDAIVVPFRCDSPTLRRHMRLEIRQESHQGIGLKSILEKVEPCELRPLLHVRYKPSEGLITMCSCCKGVLIESRGWLSLEETYDYLERRHVVKRPSIRYTVCMACSTQAARPA